MSSLKLELRNDLEGENVMVKEGNAGIFRQITILKPGKTYTLRHDPNATYREFVLVTLPNQKQLPLLSTDLFQELKEIIVFKDGDIYDWRGTPRVARFSATGEAATGEAPQASTTSRRGGFRTALQRFFT